MVQQVEEHADKRGSGRQPYRQGRLADLRAIVTGASRGIGRAIAVAMAAEGADLVLAATNESALQEAAAQCANAGREPAVRILNVTERAACFALLQEVGPVDILVNAAGIARSLAFLDHTEQDFRDLLEVNLFGTLHLMQAALPAMIERRFGRVINIASTAGKWGSPNQAAYNSSKHAVVGLTRCAAVEMGQHGVTVNAICPGLVQTDILETGFGPIAQKLGVSVNEILQPIIERSALRRILMPEEIAGLSVFLASKEGSGTTGQSIVVDGGMLFI